MLNTQGITNHIVPMMVDGMNLSLLFPGKIFFVNNSTLAGYNALGGSDANKGNFKQPFATIAEALSLCVAGRGDVIALMPGHVETLAATLTVSTANVCILGLNSGANRGSINITATGATIALAAAGCALVNVLVTGGITSITSCVTVSAANCLLHANEIRDVTGQMLVGVTTTAAADYLYINQHVHNGSTSAGSTHAIKIVGGNRIQINAQYIDGNFSTGGIGISTTATTNILVHDVKYFRQRNAADIFIVDTVTGSTGQIGPNINIRLSANAANITEAITGATFHVFDPVNVVNLAGEKAMLINWTASLDA